jgi:hypothetical protein
MGASTFPSGLRKWSAAFGSVRGTELLHWEGESVVAWNVTLPQPLPQAGGEQR